MKIQPINITNISHTNNSLKHNQNIVSNSGVSQNSITQLSNIYYQPISFGSTKKRAYSTSNRKLAEKSGDFAVSRRCDIPCPACGKKMLNQSKFNAIAEELRYLEPEQYLDCLGKYTQYMRPVEESVYREISALSEKEGETKDIRTLLVKLRDTKMPILQDAQMRQIKKMRSLARTLPADEKAVLMPKLDKLQSIVRKNNSEAPFRRKIMIDRISKIKISNEKKYEKLQIIAKNFPTSSDMNSAWIVKYSGKNKHNEPWASYDIALRFLSSSIANTDHILAYSIENNHDDISNYMSMHNACNAQKGNKPFLQWLNEDKENRIKYMQEYFDSVGELIKDKKIGKKKYRDYVAYATQTIFETSKGRVKLFEDTHPAFEQPTVSEEDTNVEDSIREVITLITEGES